MAKIFGAELREAVLARKARLQEIMADRQRRINNWETDEDDCFISQRSDEQGISECNMQLAILDSDGTMEMEVVMDQEGNEVRTHWFTNQWGKDTIVGNGVFASSLKALLKKTGWTLQKIRVPVWTKFCSNGSGMYGVYTGSYQQVRWHTNMVTGEYVGYPD